MTGNRIVPMAITHLERVVMEIERFLSRSLVKGSFVSEITENPYAVYFVAWKGNWLSHT